MLVGGRGERLGGAVKPLLLHPEGDTLLDRILARLAPRVGGIHLAVTEALRASFADRAQLLIDPGEGPARALYEAARALEAPWILLVGGDHPRPDPAVLDALGPPRGDALAAVCEGVLQPLWALYRRDAVRGLGPRRSLRAVLEELEAERVELRSSSFESVNYPEDIARYGLRRPEAGPRSD